MKLSDTELSQILEKGGLALKEAFNPKGSYRKDHYLFTQCIHCGTEAHYRLKYILDKNSIGEAVCRVCYWKHWYREGHELNETSINQLIAHGYSREQLIAQGVIKQQKGMGWQEAQAHAKAKGYELIDLIHGDNPGDDILLVRCISCGRQTPMRPEDISHGCSCGGLLAKGGIKYSKTSNPKAPHSIEGINQEPLTPEPVTLLESESPGVSWWDADRNVGTRLEDVTEFARKELWWKCPNCGASFKAPVFRMSRNPRCPACSEIDAIRFDITYAMLKNMVVADIPELMADWADDRDPHTIPAAYIYGCKFKCAQGHHPFQTPYSYLTRGCMVCRGQQTKSEPSQIYLRESNPELSEEWLAAEDGAQFTPDNVRSGSKRKVKWQCIACGGTWVATVRDREKRENNRCPHCGKVMGSLAWKFPSLAEEWSDENPTSPWNTKPFGKLDFKPKWVCRINPKHTWIATTASRINQGKGCPCCSNKDGHLG